MALRPDRHTLFTVVAGTVIGMPPLDGRLAGGDLARPGLQDLAHEHVVDIVGRHAGALERGLDGDARPDRMAGSPASAPDSLPIGVRAPAMITEPAMADLQADDDRRHGAIGARPASECQPRHVLGWRRRLEAPRLPPVACRACSEILDAIQAGASGDDIGALPVPESYRAAFVSRDETAMFEGIASSDKDPRKSLHVDDVATPELAPDEAFVAVMASSINFNTVWTSIFEPLPTFGFLDRLGKESRWGARHALPYHVVGSDASGVVARGRAPRCGTGSRATGSSSTATTSTTRTRRPTTTRCWPPTSASGASRPTSAASPTSRSSRPTSSCPSRPTSRGRRRRATRCATRPPTACSCRATAPP